MNDRTVTDRDQFANDRGRIVIDMNDGVILNVRAWADHDAADVAAQNRAVPNTRFFTDGDGRARNDERGGVNPLVQSEVPPMFQCPLFPTTFWRDSKRKQ